MFYVLLKRLSTAPLLVALTVFATTVPVVLNGGPTVAQFVEAGQQEKEQQEKEQQETEQQETELTSQEMTAEGDRLFQEGIDQFNRVQLQTALQTFQQVLEIRQRLGDRSGEADALSWIGKVHNGLNQYAEAAATLEQAIQLYQSLENPIGLANALNTLGQVLSGIDREQDALAVLQQALTLYREGGDSPEEKRRQRLGEGQTLNNIGVVQIGLGQFADARVSLEQALVIREQEGDRFWLPETQAWLGLVLINSDEQADGFALLDDALANSRTVGNPSTEVGSLFLMGLAFSSLSEFDRAIAAYQQAWTLTQSLETPFIEGLTSFFLASTHVQVNNYEQALGIFQQSLPIFQELGNQTYEGLTLQAIGWMHVKLQQYEDALEFSQQALTVHRTVGNRQAEANTLKNIGQIHTRRGQSRQAIPFFQDSAALYRELGASTKEAESLLGLAIAHFPLGQYQQMIAIGEALLAKGEELQNRQIQGYAYGALAMGHVASGNTDRAIELAELAIAISQELQDVQLETIMLAALGEAHLASGNYEESLEFAQAVLSLAEESHQPDARALALRVMGGAYRQLQQYDEALTAVQESLALARSINDIHAEVGSLVNLSRIYNAQGDIEKTLEYAQQGLALTQQIDHHTSEVWVLVTLADIYIDLGKYEQASELLQQTHTLAQNTDNPTWKAESFLLLAISYFTAGETAKTIEMAQQGIEAARAIQRSTAESWGFLLLAAGHYELNELTQALEFAQQGLALARESQATDAIRTLLVTSGSLYRQMGQYDDAMAAYQDALSLGPNNVVAHTGLARMYTKLNLPEVAIVHYKQAVNGVEATRGRIQGLSRELQESFLEGFRGIERVKNVDLYRELADLLLGQGRVLEAQQVLELLKAEEISEFTRSGNQSESSDIALSLIEQEILKEHGSLVTFGQRVHECQQTNCAEKAQLVRQRRQLIEEYNDRMKEIVTDIREREQLDRDGFFDPTFLSTGARDIVEAQPGTMLIYPLVLEDKLWLLWAAPNGIANRIEVPVSRYELGETVLQFSQSLRNNSPQSLQRLQDSGQQLYEWLIQPLESEITENNITNLVFSLDRSTRYIPMAALFDGEQYLIENYTVSTIISAEKTDTSGRIATGSSVLALGVSEGIPPFNALHNVPVELDGIVREAMGDDSGVFPGAQFLNQDFTFDTLEQNLFGHRILHVATHGEFVPNLPDESYLLLGDGTHLKIPQINTLYDLTGYDMVVLSACETALGAPDQDGVEISGLAHYFLTDNRADTVIASLWKVDDLSTSHLMQEFYDHLASGDEPLGRAEALRRAQLALLRGEIGEGLDGSDDARDDKRGIRLEMIEGESPNTAVSATAGRDLSHPYYWAPFILIGNSF